MFALLDANGAVARRGPVVPSSPARASVRLEEVSFAYPSRPGLVLARFDLELEPGEITALVGESGAGKSTVAGLLLRLLEPSSGRVTAGGVDLAVCRDDAWRRLVAWAPQRPALLRASVAANIRLGDPKASDARVREAAALAGADGFVQALPSGYDTLVGDGGRTLSLGERRRIALARAFLRDAPLLILDEPSADLDPDSVEHLIGSLHRLRGERTMLLIAHRHELISLADRVVVLEGGAAVPMGVGEAA
jgi:ABC-type multidrug transport system fused ATPase/permease subunit